MTTKNNNRDLLVPAPYVGVIPPIVRTRGGALFETGGDVWDIREATLRLRLHFDASPPLQGPFLSAFQATLVWYAENTSLSHLKNMFHRSQDLFEFKFASSGRAVAEIASVDILNYKSHLREEREWYLSFVSGFLKKWHALGYEGVAKDAIALFGQIRLKGNPKGVATATMDPVKGPYTAIELEALQQGLNNAYGRGEIALDEFVLCWLTVMLGQRPTQYARLRVCDVRILHEKDGARTYSIRMPRAKRRDGDPRGQFKERALTPEIGKLLERYASEVESRFVGLIPVAQAAPLFPGEYDDAAPDGYAYHPTSAQVSAMLAGALKKLRVMSERTGDLIVIGAKRFRSTIGTRAAEEGHGELVIAELLDHSDTQNVGVYISSTPAVVERIDRAVAMQMAPLAQAFAGKLIEGPAEASRVADPASQIRAPGITGDFCAISSCGKHGFCGFLKPVACYTCNSFEPWLDGPHEQVLGYLMAERERLMAGGDTRIASINDRAIYAVAEVIQLCEMTLAERGVAHG
jgi:hypothetical protein